MGAVTDPAQDQKELAEVHRIHPDARKWILHHLGNALAGAFGMMQIGEHEKATHALEHAISDLRMITPPELRVSEPR